MYNPTGVTFVDLGAFDGRSSRAYEANNQVRHVHLWEPNPLAPVKPPGVPSTVHQAAAWIDNGYASLYMSSTEKHYGKGQGSTLIEEKTTGRLDKVAPVRVVTIDLAEWLYDRYDQTLVVKMNIEGAEYPLLPHLAACGALNIPREWIISWHDAKVGKATEETDDLRELLLAVGYIPACPLDYLPDSFERYLLCE